MHGHLPLPRKATIPEASSSVLPLLLAGLVDVRTSRHARTDGSKLHILPFVGTSIVPGVLALSVLLILRKEGPSIATVSADHILPFALIPRSDSLENKLCQPFWWLLGL